MRQLRPRVWELSISAAGIRHYRTVRGGEQDATFSLAGFAAEITVNAPLGAMIPALLIITSKWS
ncbi:MAG: hypothetical protein QOJ23_3427 [Actinomycetota bacterium]|jgi:hypothetical protein|nr:hypothetical protein [Actinomycetota bacterium]